MDEGKRTITGEAERISEKSGKNRRKRKKVIRRLIAAAAILVVLGFAGFIVARKLQADYSVIYDPYTASIGTITNSLSYSGSMQLINNETYTASSATKVREVYVSQGDGVQEGDRLIRLNDGTTVTAAFSGTVNRIDVAKGDAVTKDQNLVQVTDYDNMRVTFRVGESDIQDVRAGQEVMITVSSIGARFSSAIDNIDYSTYTGNSVAYYTATVDVDSVAFNRGYYSVDETFYFLCCCEVYTATGALPTSITGIAVSSKRVVLYGSDGNVKRFSSDTGDRSVRARLLCGI